MKLNITYFGYECIKGTQNQRNLIKQKYPYVDIKIKYSNLEKALTNSNIISERNGYAYIDVKGYENYLMCEEEKEKCFYENRYKENKLDFFYRRY